MPTEDQGGFVTSIPGDSRQKTVVPAPQPRGEALPMMSPLIKCVQAPVGNWPSQFTGPHFFILQLPSCFQPLTPHVCIAVYNHKMVLQRCSVLTANLGAGCDHPSSYSRSLWDPEKPSHWSEITQLKTQPRSD